MKERILGIDAGSNSLGWAIIDYDPESDDNKYTFIKAGVNIFEEGVKIDDKSKAESSRAAERTAFRHIRLGYWRRKIRKIALLKILMEHDLCPRLSDDELRGWRSEKKYPLNEEFRQWLRSDESVENPYYFRNLCLTQQLDLTTRHDRYILGRAIYHINQRRGFLSNRKESTKAADGAVMDSIKNIDGAMAELGFEYLGEYFYSLFGKEKIRGKYTDRLKHYEKELLAICERQHLGADLTADLRRTVITQRPLKSQKHTVGHCVFEKGKSRCPVSHPLFEQFRMFAFINSIKIQTPDDTTLRPLTQQEKKKIIPLFLRKSKKVFNFEDIAKALSTGKKNYCYYKSREAKDYRFNFHLDTSVSGCAVTAQLADVFDAPCDVDGWLENAAESYLKGDGKNRFEIMNDIWHALFFFDDEDKLKQFAIDKLQLDDEHAEKFAKISIPGDYASMSLKAIRKILPYMKQYGMVYSHAVFVANLPAVVDVPIDEESLLPMLPREDAERIVRVIEEYHQPPHPRMSLEDYLKQHIARTYDLTEEQYETLGKKLYHPSNIDVYPKVKTTTAWGYYQLGSPRTNSLRNPMAMHSLFRIRHVINTLLAKGLIDKATIIHIEMARELNDSNRRAGIRSWQTEREKEAANYAKGIKEHFGAEYEPTDTDILKYRLWEEQGHMCLYTGEMIGIEDLFNGNKFDIEHTIPRSRGGDSTEANLTLCRSDFNRQVKQAKLPSELANYDEILERIASWEKHLAELDTKIRKMSTRGATDIDARNRKIQQRHALSLQRDYWREKIARFKMTEVPDGFARRQGVDAGVVSRYGRMYLKSLFPKVHIVKGVATAEFRKVWGLQSEYEKKCRDNHSHHAIDAVTIACIGPNEYSALAQYYHDAERRAWSLDSKRAVFQKPWSTFTEDVLALPQTIIIRHHTRDNMGKHTRKRIKGTHTVMQGDTARDRLHQETIYGAIDKSGEVQYVIRRQLASMKESDVKNIVDHAVRRKVMEAMEQHGSLAKAVEAGIWMNREKGIRINKVRSYATGVKRPIELRKLRDTSKHPYKRMQYVANDSNYMAGIYVGTNAKGKEVRDFVVVNTLEAAKQLKAGSDKKQNSLLPQVSPKGLPLRWMLKIGTMVLLYEKSHDEIFKANKKELIKRLYKITGMSSMIFPNRYYGVLKMTHSQEARPSGQIKFKNGVYTSGEELRDGITMLHTQFNALVEGVDFRIDEDGEIHWLSR